MISSLMACTEIPKNDSFSDTVSGGLGSLLAGLLSMSTAPFDMAAVIQSLQGVEIVRGLIQHLVKARELSWLVQDTELNVSFLEIGQNHRKAEKRTTQASHVTNHERVTRLETDQHLDQARPISQRKHPGTSLFKNTFTVRLKQSGFLLAQTCACRC